MFCMALILLSACQISETNKSTILKEKNVKVDGHNSQNALDWWGLYRGYLPCASCPGILIQIVLHSDGQYLEQTRYTDQEKIFVSSGAFKWGPEGRVISLYDEVANEYSHYQVVENGLLRLSENKQVITGNLAELYRLNKMQLNLSGQSWQLMSMGDYEYDDKLNNRVAMNITEDGVMTGQAPCNRFFAQSQSQQDDNSLIIGDIGSTKMACPFLSQENEFFKRLASTDNYEITNNLLLLKSKQQVLLVFEWSFVDPEDNEN